MTFLIFLLASYGVTNIIAGSKIFEGLRKWLAALPGRRGNYLGYWAKCYMCMGFTVGILLYFAGLGDWYPSITRWQYPAKLIAIGSISSGFCWAVRVVLARLGEDKL